MNEIRTVEGVIDALGGVRQAANNLGQNPSTVSMWKNRKRIPPEHFLTVYGALEQIGQTVTPEVFGMNSP